MNQTKLEDFAAWEEHWRVRNEQKIARLKADIRDRMKHDLNEVLIFLGMGKELQIRGAEDDDSPPNVEGAVKRVLRISRFFESL